MKREKEVPAELLAYLEERKQQIENKVFNTLDIFCSVPIRAVKMKILLDDGSEDFRTVIIPAVDVYTTDKAILKKGFLKRDVLSFFISGTHRVFPYGHIYAESGYVCLGSIFVPSAVPEMSATMPLETLFLHNDRNLSHGNSHLRITQEQAAAIGTIMDDNQIHLSQRFSMLAAKVIEKPGEDIIAHDEIWNLSARVAEQKSLPEALHIMSDVYGIIFQKKNKVENHESEE